MIVETDVCADLVVVRATRCCALSFCFEFSNTAVRCAAIYEFVALNVFTCNQKSLRQVRTDINVMLPLPESLFIFLMLCSYTICSYLLLFIQCVVVLKSKFMSKKQHRFVQSNIFCGTSKFELV